VASAPIEITVPYQDRSVERPPAERVRRLRRHLVDSLRDLRAAKRPDRLIKPNPPAPPEDAVAVLRAGCVACRGHCCLGGGDHAWLDERTMARVRRDRPQLDARGIIAAYLGQIAERSYAGSCLFHGAAGCTLEAGLRADLCLSYYCNGLQAFLRHRAGAGQDVSPVVVRAVADQPRPGGA
jgi:hypothetical protein